MLLRRQCLAFLAFDTFRRMVLDILPHPFTRNTLNLRIVKRMAEVRNTIPIRLFLTLFRWRWKNDTVDGGFEKTACPEGEEVAYVLKVF
jgi:hypothetical protein